MPVEAAPEALTIRFERYLLAVVCMRRRNFLGVS